MMEKDEIEKKEKKKWVLVLDNKGKHLPLALKGRT